MTVRRILPLLLMILFLSSPRVFSQSVDDVTPLNLDVQSTEQQVTGPPEIWKSLFKMTTALGIVLALIGGAAWVAKKYLPVQKIGAVKQESIQILSQKNIGQRQSLLLIKVGEATLLIGKSPGSISSLARLDDPYQPINLEDNNSVQQVTNTENLFEEQLKNAL